MKKSLVGAIVGGIIVFIWQFLSFGLINFHRPAQDYTEKQGAIMDFLNSQGLKDGGYYLPNVPEGTGREEMEKAMKAAEGKPWVLLQYHSKQDSDMVMNSIRSFLVNVIAVLLLCWMIRRMAAPSFNTILLSALAAGLIVFFNAPYINHIWYKTFDIWYFFLDAIVSWGIVGLWLGWWLKRPERTQGSAVRTGQRPAEMV